MTSSDVHVSPQSSAAGFTSYCLMGETFVSQDPDRVPEEIYHRVGSCKFLLTQELIGSFLPKRMSQINAAQRICPKLAPLEKRKLLG